MLGSLGSSVAGEPSHRYKAVSNNLSTETTSHQTRQSKAGCADTSSNCRPVEFIQTQEEYLLASARLQLLVVVWSIILHLAGCTYE